MQFIHVSTARIADEWPVFAQTLAPAVRQDPGQTLEGLHRRLESGADVLLEITGPGYCLLGLEVTSDLVCWTKYLAGHINGGPKARAEIIRSAVSHIENVAKAAGCTEHRICGRDWSRVLPSYSPFEGFRNGLKKELQ